jgi:hypothetical protein
MLAGACTQDNPAYESNRDAGWPDRGSLGEVGLDVPASELDPAPVDVRPAADAGVRESVAEVAVAPEVAAEVAAPVDAMNVTPPSAGLVLHWRLDEASGAFATDSSGNGFDGTYMGSPVPAAISEAAPTTFFNPGCRQFRADVTQSVQLGRTAAVLQPTAGLTVSVWFRTTLMGRADLLNHGGDYFLRIMSGEIEFVRRRPATSSPYYVTATGPAPRAVDGQWHHAAGVATLGTMAMYLDGVLVANHNEVVAFTYTARDFMVGRSGTGAPPFEGLLDDVRIYDRALGETEIKALAARRP